MMSDDKDWETDHSLCVQQKSFQMISAAICWPPYVLYTCLECSCSQEGMPDLALDGAVADWVVALVMTCAPGYL
jgi:hypothetical protein